MRKMKKWIDKEDWTKEIQKEKKNYERKKENRERDT